jgi:transposase
MARHALHHIDRLDAEIAAFDARIQVELRPARHRQDLLITIPGVARYTSEVILAETGGDMTRFPTAAALASWAGSPPARSQPQTSDSSTGTKKPLTVAPAARRGHRRTEAAAPDRYLRTVRMRS